MDLFSGNIYSLLREDELLLQKENSMRRAATRRWKDGQWSRSQAVPLVRRNQSNAISNFFKAMGKSFYSLIMTIPDAKRQRTDEGKAPFEAKAQADKERYKEEV